MILLFLKERAAEEIKLTFQKAKMIHAFSFVFGDDFNFFIATNIANLIPSQFESANLYKFVRILLISLLRLFLDKSRYSNCIKFSGF